MYKEKLQDRLDAMVQVHKATQGRPCAICTERSQGSYKFKPRYPENFGLEPGRSLIVPICVRCLKTGVEEDFLEANLKHIGVRVEL